MPPLASLTADSDYSDPVIQGQRGTAAAPPYLAVSRKPQFTVIDEMDDYAEDFSTFCARRLLPPTCATCAGGRDQKTGGDGQTGLALDEPEPDLDGHRPGTEGVRKRQPEDATVALPEPGLSPTMTDTRNPIPTNRATCAPAGLPRRPRRNGKSSGIVTFTRTCIERI